MDTHPDQPPAPAPEAAAAPPARPRADPWAHRRGEPRLFAFLWTIFLFSATAAIFLSALTLGTAAPEVVRPATRALLSVMLVGITLLWPMVRLSQLADRHPVTGCIQDLVVILIPAQAVIWPQWFAWLGRWPFAVIAAVAVWTIAWALLSGGLLALAQAEHLRAERAHCGDAPLRWPAGPWMLVFLALALAGALPALLSRVVGPDPAQPIFRAVWMLSPVTGVYELTRERTWSGVSAFVLRPHWIAVIGVLAAAAPLWAAALKRTRGIAAPEGLH
jgi:hypothetical protein